MNQATQRGFTLIELLVVALLAAILSVVHQTTPATNV
jgi:prepilin-type N-terminal cleavage/methylation domain-containing protein